jgi:hypothetical protein
MPIIAPKQPHPEPLPTNWVSSEEKQFCKPNHSKTNALGSANQIKVKNEGMKYHQRWVLTLALHELQSALGPTELKLFN